MKKLLLVVVALVVVAGCAKDSCDGYQAEYKGGKCTVAWREKFLGSYTVSGQPFGAYTLQITEGSAGVKSLTLNNIDSTGTQASATLTNGYEFEIPAQTNNGKTFSGHGYYIESGEYLNLTINIGGTGYSFSAVKQ